MFPPYMNTISYRGGYAVCQSNGDGGWEWHIYATREPDSYLRTVGDHNGRPCE